MLDFERVDVSILRRDGSGSTQLEKVVVKRGQAVVGHIRHRARYQANAHPVFNSLGKQEFSAEEMEDILWCMKKLG